MSFGLGTFREGDGPPFPALVADGTAWALDYPDMLSLLDMWETAFARLENHRRDPAAGIPLDRLRIHPPVRPRQIFGTGANYRKHVIEIAASHDSPANAGLSHAERRTRAAAQMDARAAEGMPFVFVKAGSAVAGPGDPIVIPRGVTRLDWECELAVVIGRHARHVPRAEAMGCIAGYAVANDLTARDRLNRPDLGVGFDWFAAKCGPGFLPLGPVITPAAFVADPMDLRITLKVNGETRQDDSTADMLFDIARQIEYVSSMATLLPGDVIVTGSPAGNGGYWGRYLQPGDVVESAIDGLGRMTQTCVAESD